MPFILLAAIWGKKTVDEAKLIKRITLNDEYALAELYGLYSKLLFNLILKYLKYGVETEEVVQNIFMQVWDEAAAFDSRNGNVHDWLLEISRKKLIDNIHLNNEPENRELFNEIQNVSAYLQSASEMVEPPAKLKKQIMAGIRDKQKVHSGSFLERISEALGLNKPKMAFAITIILMTAVLILIFYTTSLVNTVQIQQTKITSLSGELQKKEELLNVLQAKQIEVVLMNGQKAAPQGYGKIIWDPDKKTAILHISNLPPVQNKDYQLWVIKNNKPVSAGIFDVKKSSNENFFKIENLVETNKQNITAFTVTLEPKGGVTQPTGEIYLLGKPSINN